MKNQNNQLLQLRLLRTRSSCYQKNIGAEFTHLYILTFIVLGDFRDPPHTWPL